MCPPGHGLNLALLRPVFSPDVLCFTRGRLHLALQAQDDNASLHADTFFRPGSPGSMLGSL